MSSSIAAVVVTCNRLALLKECLAALKCQTRAVDEIIVVDNGSTDETPKWLAEQTGITVLTQPNLGSSGGQFTGIKAAYLRGHDWFWVMDDDTIPHPDCLEQMAKAPAFSREDTGVIASRVVWTDGSDHVMNAPVAHDTTRWMGSVLEDHCIEISTCSFVSMMISRAAVAKVGLPLRHMFIWFDDMEYTKRIANPFRNYCALESIALHKTAENVGTPHGSVPRQHWFKYQHSVRNQVVLIRLLPIPAFNRFNQVVKLYWRNLKLVLRQQAPPQALIEIFKGLFVDIRPEFPE
jgi:GT2 family glycosyltransferase